jgi:tRNA G18 (ribose-2'-O)-methylase SpoU
MLTVVNDEETVKNNFNVHDDIKHLSVPELKAITDADRLPYAVASFNVDGNLNIGIMIRNAVLMGAERFIVFGRRHYDRRSCVGSYHYIDIDNAGGLDFQKDVYDFNIFWNTLDKYNYYPVFIELHANSRPLDIHEDVISRVLNTYGKKPCFIFGSESKGIPAELIDTANEIISIPQLGVIRSINVSSASAMVMFSLMSNYRVLNKY